VSLEERQQMIVMIDQAREEGARLAPACDTVEIDPGTYRRWQHAGHVVADRRATAPRPEPHNKLSAHERAQVLQTCHRPEFESLPPSQIVPTLADRGEYLASESSFYRVLRKANEQHDRGRAKPRQKRAKPDEYQTRGPNQCWTWDVTWLKSPVNGMYFYLYMMVDIFSRKITAWEVHETESGELAAQLLRRGVMAEGCAATLRCLHADNGAIQKSSTLRATLEWLGVAASYSRPRVSNDNPFSEALFRTAKYRPEFPADGFASLEAARQWCAAFVRWYNEEHKHSAIKFVTPGQRHRGEDIALLADRDDVYRQAKAANPSRWRGETRNWERPEIMTLNPDNPKEKLKKAA
jgi:transposase InsO family protein